MTTPDTTTPAARRLMVICCVVLAGHVLAALYFTMLPDSYLHRRRIALWYQEYLLPGPFYRADQLYQTDHGHIRYYVNGTWSVSRDYTDEAFYLYHRQPWRYDALKQADYSRGLFRAAYAEYKRGTIRSGPLSDWPRLTAFISEQWLPSGALDSVHMHYTFRTWVSTRSVDSLSTGLDFIYTPKRDGSH